MNSAGNREPDGEALVDGGARTQDGGYDVGYRSSPCFWGKVPGSLVQSSVSLLPPLRGLRVLDAGCGEGKNAVFFSRQGAYVDAFDISAVAVSNARAAWGPTEPRVAFAVDDIRSVVLPPGRYDVVVCYGLLHCVGDADVKAEVVERLRAATRPGGTHIVCALNNRCDGFAEGHLGFRPVLETHEFYLSLYSDCELSMDSDRDLIEDHPPNHVEHRHAVTRFVARLPL
jgi:tellurite methyltransferase